MTHEEPLSTQPLSTDFPAATPWPEARQRLVDAETYWLATVRPDGRPHVMPLMGVWVAGSFYFSSSESSRKAANLARNPHCVVTVGSLVQPAVDLILQGEAAKVSDEAELHRVAEAYAGKYGWEVTVRDGAFHGDGAPTAGPPPYSVFAVTATTAIGLPGIAGTDETGQARHGMFSPTRWRF